MALSCSGGVAIRYVLRVLWVTSRLAVVGRMVIPGQSLMSVNALLGSMLPSNNLKVLSVVWKQASYCMPL